MKIAPRYDRRGRERRASPNARNEFEKKGMRAIGPPPAQARRAFDRCPDATRRTAGRASELAGETFLLHLGELFLVHRTQRHHHAHALASGKELHDHGAVIRLHVHAPHTLAEGVPVGSVSIAEEIGRGGVVRKSVHDLLSGLLRGRMRGDVEVQDSAPMVSEDDQDREHPKLSGGNGKEVDRDQVPDMVREERAPGLHRAVSRASGSGERRYAPPFQSLQCRYAPTRRSGIPCSSPPGRPSTSSDGTAVPRYLAFPRGSHMNVYNTRSRIIERFPLGHQRVSLYVCGITPYDTTHLGHAFTYTVADVLVRHLRARA